VVNCVGAFEGRLIVQMPQKKTSRRGDAGETTQGPAGLESEGARRQRKRGTRMLPKTKERAKRGNHKSTYGIASQQVSALQSAAPSGREESSLWGGRLLSGQVVQNGSADAPLPIKKAITLLRARKSVGIFGRPTVRMIP